MRNFLSISMFLLSLATSFAQNNTLFDQGNTLYNQGKYTEAIDKYQAILATGNHSAGLYFNLANAYYKLNNIASSNYFYEKALVLSPNDKEIKNNIAFARNMTIDKIDVVPEVGLSRLIKNMTHFMSFDDWAKLTVLLVFCFIILFLIYYFTFSTVTKRLTFISSFIFVFIACISLAFAFHKFNLDKKNNPAIVFTQESKVKSDPNLKSEESFRLHEGTKVQVLESYNNWKKIKLADGKTGWVIKDDIKEL